MDENPYKSPEEKSGNHEQAFKRHAGRLRAQALKSIIMLAVLSFAGVVLVGGLLALALYIALKLTCS